MTMKLLPRSLSILVLAASACAPARAALPAPTRTAATPAETAPPATAAPPAETAPPADAPSPPPASPEPSPPASESAPVPAVRLCSPLQEIALADLPSLVSNPYHPPPPGSDDPHHGVDLAVRLPGSQVAVSGHPVQAALPGRVVMVLNDRFPYGSAVLVETALDPGAALWAQPAGIPTSAPTLAPVSALTCPPASLAGLDSAGRSLYVLYAHLLQAPDLQVGEVLACGQPVGLVGSSGNTLNPHLHFEVRAGPSGAQFGGMAHYDNSATQEEMANYCLWRTSGLFQLVDPLKILALAQR